MERHFDEDLKALKSKLLQMAALVEESIALAIQSLRTGQDHLARQVLAKEDAVNLMEIEIEDLCLKLLALKQPMAGDLRFITSAMKIGAELERMGDQAVNIAERTLYLLQFPPLKPLIDIPQMSALAQHMVRDAITAFVNQDEKLARDICIRDDEVDKINDQIFRELLTYMMEDPANIPRAVALILVGRHLERIADHATNIGEDVIYLTRGKTIKHHIETRRPPSSD